MSSTKFYFPLMVNAGTSWAGGQTGYMSWHNFYISESNAQERFCKVVITDIVCCVAENTLNGSTTIELRKNGAGTGETLTFSAGETGRKNKLINILLEDGDTIDFLVTVGGTTGGIRFASGGIHYG